MQYITARCALKQPRARKAGARDSIASMYYIVGLGNPDAEHEGTRHNAGRVVLAHFLRQHGLSEMVRSKKYASRVSDGVVEGERVLVLYPETYMNKSGSAVTKAVTSAKKAEKLIVVHDDLDLPLGAMRISFSRGSGGHKGLESIIRAIKTRDFARVRLGIAPTTPTGRLRKPKGEEKTVAFLLSDFKKPELAILKKISKRVSEAVETIIAEDVERAMNQYN